MANNSKKKKNTNKKKNSTNKNRNTNTKKTTTTTKKQTATKTVEKDTIKVSNKTTTNSKPKNTNTTKTTNTAKKQTTNTTAKKSTTSMPKEKIKVNVNVEKSLSNDIQNEKYAKLKQINKKEKIKEEIEEKELLDKINQEKISKDEIETDLHENKKFAPRNSKREEPKRVLHRKQYKKVEEQEEEEKEVLHRNQYKNIDTNVYEDIEPEDEKTNTLIEDELEEDVAPIIEPESTQEFEEETLDEIVKGVQEQLNSEKEQEESVVVPEEENKDKKKEKPKKKKKRIRLKTNVKFIIAILIFIVSLIVVEVGFVNRKLIPHQPKIDVDYTPTTDVEEPTDPKLLEIQKLYEQNNDLIGWLTIEGTKIDYPVMFTKGEDYYLRKDFYKKKSTAGTLFIDNHQTMEPKDINIIIHGHNMHDGTMFADLKKYKKKDFYEKHKTLVYYTLEERQEYEIIAVFLSKVYYVSDQVFKYYKFYGEQDENSYNDYIKNIKKLSLYDIDTTATYPEELITLSTCDYYTEDGRLAVVAKRIS